MGSDVAVDERLADMAADLKGHGLHVTGPSGAKPSSGEPDMVYLRVRDPATGQYAEISLVKHGPDRDDWFLQLSYWTDSGTDPDGQLMADQVRRLLGGPLRAPGSRITAVPGLVPPATPSGQVRIYPADQDHSAREGKGAQAT